MKQQQQPFTPNKKLILHFDIQNVIRLPTNVNKDVYVYDLCSSWLWGKLQFTNKQHPDKVTGWKLIQNTLSAEKPDPELTSYQQYIDGHLKPEKEEKQKLLMNLSKGPAAKAKTQIEKSIKNITIPKTLAEALKESNDGGRLVQRYLQDGKYQILPAFYKLLLTLKKTKRQFAIIIRNINEKDNHDFIIQELNLFFSGQHPLYNGKNGTPLIKMDGSKGTKNFLIDDGHRSVFYSFGQNEVFATYGTSQATPHQSDLELLKQKFKSRKGIRLIQGYSQLFAYSHTLLSQSASLYQVNSKKFITIDTVDYLTHEIYFTNCRQQEISLYSALGEKIDVTKTPSSVIQVDIFELLRDVDFFIKKVEKCQAERVAGIEKKEKTQGINMEEEPEDIEPKESKEIKEDRQNDRPSEYLRKNLFPVLDAALRQVDLLRPRDPIGFIALYCLKYKDKLED